MAYLLDANIFIQAKNLHYGMDFCPAFWDWLVHANQTGSLYSVEQVGDELLDGNDELAQWAKQRGNKFFLPPDGPTIPAANRSPHATSAAGKKTFIATDAGKRPGLLDRRPV